jgi:hypothetical protein
MARFQANQANGMNGRQFFTILATIAIGFGGAACSPFSGYVADHWPHWAGGMPDDVPPRRGTPGYNEFISHGQTNPANTAPAQATPAAVTPVPAAPAARTKEPAPADPTIAPGTLY